MATRLSRYRAAPAASICNRRAERLFVALRRVAIDCDEAPVEAVLGDVSPFGCRLEMPGSYAIGQAVMLRIGGGMELAASVVWNGDGLVGCRFDKPMPAPAMRALTIRG